MGMVDEVIADARSRAGLTDLGDESFHEGLEALLTAPRPPGPSTSSAWRCSATKRPACW